MTILVNPARFRLGADTAIGRLLGDEPSGMALDFTTGQGLIRDDSFPVAGFLGDVNSLLTYTAPSPKLVWGSDGVLKFASHNVALNSDTVPWTSNFITQVANAALSPTGTMTARRIVPNSGLTNSPCLYATVSPAITGATGVLSCHMKSGEYTKGFLRFGGPGPQPIAVFDLAAGTVLSIQGGTAAITPAGNGWYRCSLTYPAIAGNNVPNVGVASNSYTVDAANVNVTADGTSGIYAWGVQIERNASPSAYLPTTSAARYNIPLDHDPVTHAPLGVLIEEQRTNTCMQSQTFDNASWVKTGATITADNIAAPDGTSTADKWVEDTSNGVHQLHQSISLGASPNTISIYCKAAGRSWLFLRIDGGTPVGAFFNVSTGVVGTIQAGVTTATIQSVGNGWYRCSITRPIGGGSFYTAVQIASADNVVSYTGDGVSGLYLWGVQAEAGSFATSHIPTTTAQVTRAGDNLTMALSLMPSLASGVSTRINVADYGPDMGGTNAAYPFYFVGSGNNRIRLAKNDAGTNVERWTFEVYGDVGPAGSAATSGNNATVAGVAARHGGSVHPTAGVNYAINGTSFTPGTAAAVGAALASLTTLQFYHSVGLKEIGHVKTLTVLPRVMTASELARWTT